MDRFADDESQHGADDGERGQREVDLIVSLPPNRRSPGRRP